MKTTSPPVPATTPGVSTSTLATARPETCTDAKPQFVSNIFAATKSTNSLKIYFSPLIDTADYYISYSTNSSAQEHGVLAKLSSIGVQNFTINYLQPNKTYFFKVRGQRGCMPGDWGKVYAAKTLSKLSKPLSTTKIVPTVSPTPLPTLTPSTSPTVSDKPSVTPTPTVKQSPQTKKKCILWWCF